MGLRWHITDGRSFIATSLIKKRPREKRVHSLRVLDNLTVCKRDDLASVCEFIEINIDKPASQSRILTPQTRQRVFGYVFDENIAVKTAIV